MPNIEAARRTGAEFIEYAAPEKFRRDVAAFFRHAPARPSHCRSHPRLRS
jgi:hypothetical protein